jgi:hypothetical protein
MTYVIPDSQESSRLQLECMEYCLQASRTFVTLVKSLSPDGMLYAPFTTLTDMLSMLIATSRLLLVEIDGWDLEDARENIDLEAVLDEIMAKLTAARKVKDERVAAATVANPSSYMPDRPNEGEHDRLQIFMKLIESIKGWLGDQGLFLEREESGRDAYGKLRTSARVYVGPQNAQWNFTFFFEDLLQTGRAS